MIVDRAAMRSLLVAVALAGANGAAADEAAAVKLMGDHKCYVCHADREALAGPAFTEAIPRP